LLEVVAWYGVTEVDSEPLSSQPVVENQPMTIDMAKRVWLLNVSGILIGSPDL
jgi:hypothetical protein